MDHGQNVGGTADRSVPVVDLSLAPGERQAWDRPRPIVYLWALIEILIVTNPLQISSGLRVKALRAFGAEIGENVIFRPRTRVKFPWKIHVGDRCWIGEGVWFHNQDEIHIGSDVVISQDSFLTTGSHAHRRDMALITSPIHIGDGTWVTSRSMVLGGTTIGKSCLLTPMSVAKGNYPENSIIAGNPATITGSRFHCEGISEIS